MSEFHFSESESFSCDLSDGDLSSDDDFVYDCSEISSDSDYDDVVEELAQDDELEAVLVDMLELHSDDDNSLSDWCDSDSVQELSPGDDRDDGGGLFYEDDSSFDEDLAAMERVIDQAVGVLDEIEFLAREDATDSSSSASESLPAVSADSPPSASSAASFASASEGRSPRPGCSHYARRCMLVCPTCDGVYWCRLCHDDALEGSGDAHQLQRHAVAEIVCSACHTRQSKARDCQTCGVQFASYYCETCSLYSDRAEAKGVFHCDLCGICRLGGRDKFFHCESCDACLPVDLRDNHKCINGTMRNDCPICLEDMFSSRSVCQKLPCGHMIHSKCLNRWIKSCPFIARCPCCSKAIATYDWDEVANQIARVPLGDSELRKATVLCYECQAKTTVDWHPLAMRCLECGAFNTTEV